MILKRFYTMPRLNDPFEEVNRLRRYLDTWGGEPGYSDAAPGVFPLLNVSSTQDCYVVRAELPGINANELDITVSGNNLTISGERKIPAENKGARYHRKEREAGKFSRAVTLPGPLNPDKVEATLKNGILDVVIHKAEESKPKKITIR